ncbi:hypothetical protein KAW80_03275 [Candidatus Babeliales bacterium]|nr:hypothetical protein [Candidatus Babeliales bacterium]
MKPRIPTFSPGRILLGSFLFTISVGTFLLSLPEARTVTMSFWDVFFTATSAVCVAGLKLAPISNFTTFGKCVILALIQIGGLGLMTLSFFLVSLFLNLGMTTQLIAGEILEFKVWSRIKNFLILIIGVTFISEVIGTLLLHPKCQEFADLHNPWFIAFFTSVSAFCNAGITLFEDSLVNFQMSPLSLLTISGLMFSGSIGFIVWYDFAKMLRAYIESFKHPRPSPKFSLHTKLVIYSSVILILFASVVFWILERNNSLSHLDFGHQALNSFFTGISSRGIGFVSFAMEKLRLPTLLLFLPLMLIGASPGSTGSGIKTTTFVIFVATLVSILRNREAVEIRRRQIPNDQIYKVVAIIAIAAFWIFGITFILLITEESFTFFQIFFESVSAFGCCGLSTGITPGLSLTGKIILIITMLIGRIGSFTLVLALRKRKEKHLYQYPKERVMIG